jgi:zinc D-Ala-D-Ala carboxypeptidase
MPYLTWSRGSNLPVSTHFNAKEFTCHCGVCKFQKISRELVNRLERVRVAYGAPITVTSGYRCVNHQAALRKKGVQTAVGTSTHELSHACDIFGADMPKLLKLLEQEFKSIGIAKTFYHVDLRDDKVRRWAYV